MHKLPKVLRQGNQLPPELDHNRLQIDQALQNRALSHIQSFPDFERVQAGEITPSVFIERVVASSPKELSSAVRVMCAVILGAFVMNQGCETPDDYNGLDNVSNEDEINILNEYPNDKKVAVIINGSSEKRFDESVRRAIESLRKKGFERFYVANKKEVKANKGIKLFKFNGTNEGIDELLSELSVNSDDYLFFYTTGHGNTEGGGMCMDTGETCYSQGRLIEKLKRIKRKNGESLFMHSNCYSGGLAEAIIDSGVEGKAMSSTQNGQIGYSGFGSDFFGALDRNVDMNLDGVSEPSDWFRASIEAYAERIKKGISDNNLEPMPDGVKGTFVESDINLRIDNIERYISSKKVLIIYVPTNHKEKVLPEAIQKIKDVIGDTVNIAILPSGHSDKEEILEKCKVKNYKEFPFTILKDSAGNIQTPIGLPDLNTILEGANLSDWYAYNLQRQEQASEEIIDVTKADIIERLYKFESEKVLADAKSFADKPWAHEIISMISDKDPEAILKYAYLFEQYPWAEKIVKQSLKRHKNGHQYIFDLQTKWGKALVDEYINQNYSQSVEIISRNSNQPWGKDLEERHIRDKKWDKETTFRLAKTNSDVVLKYFDKIKDQPWAREVVEISAEIDYYALFANADKIANQPWAESLLMKYVDKYPPAVLENADKIANQPWAESLLMKYADKYPLIVLENAEKFANQPWVKNIILIALNSDNAYRYNADGNRNNPCDYIDKFADQPWAKEVIEAIDLPSAVIANFSKFADQPWAQGVIEKKVQKYLGGRYLWEYDTMEQILILLRYPWGKKIIEDAIKIQPDILIFVRVFAKHPDAEKIYLEYADRNPGHILERTDVILKYSWGKKIIKKASEKSPEYFLENLDKLADQPWAEEIIKKTIKNNVYTAFNVLKHADKFADKPWARGLIEEIGGKEPRYILWFFENFTDQPWARELIEKAAEKEPGEALKACLTKENSNEAWIKKIIERAVEKDPNYVIEYADRFIDQPWAKEIIFKAAEKGAYSVFAYWEHFEEQEWLEELVRKVVKKNPQAAISKASSYWGQPWAKSVIKEAKELLIQQIEDRYGKCNIWCQQEVWSLKSDLQYEINTARRIFEQNERERIREERWNKHWERSQQEVIDNPENLYAVNSLQPSAFKPVKEKSYVPVVNVPEIFEYFETLKASKGDSVAVLANQIFANYRDALENGHSYSSDVVVENYDGSSWSVQNSCVGFVLSAFANLPLTVTSGDNPGCYISDYRWGTLIGGKKDAFKHFIPDIAGGDSSKYYSYKEIGSDEINQKVGKNLAVGEYAIAAFWNHVFLIYKDTEGVVQMIHSGADVGGSGSSKVNQITLERYAEYNQNKHANTHFIFMPLSNIIEVSIGGNVGEISDYVSRILDKINSQQSSARLTAVNTDAIQIGGNKLGREVEALKIEFVSLDSSTALFEGGLGTFEEFKKKIADRLQPNNKNPESSLNNSLEILKRCAVGMYQVVPHFYFNMMGWKLEGEEGVKNIYNFLASKELQDKLADKIINFLGQKYNWDPYAISAAFYKGPDVGNKMYEYRKNLQKNPKTEMPKSFKAKSAGDYGSIIFYVEQLIGFYGKGTIETQDDKLAFRGALAQKESGYLANN